MTAQIRVRPDMAQMEEAEWSSLGRSHRFPCGWWLLPSILLSLAMTLALGYWLSGVIGKAMVAAGGM